MIKPTVGRVVWFYTKGYGDAPLAAIIAHVWSDVLVNLAVFDRNGICTGRPSVVLEQDDCPVPPAEKCYCTWMPYQKGQAAKTEALEAKLAP